MGNLTCGAVSIYCSVVRLNWLVVDTLVRVTCCVANGSCEPLEQLSFLMVLTISVCCIRRSTPYLPLVMPLSMFMVGSCSFLEANKTKCAIWSSASCCGFALQSALIEQTSTAEEGNGGSRAIPETNRTEKRCVCVCLNKASDGQFSIVWWIVCVPVLLFVSPISLTGLK